MSSMKLLKMEVVAGRGGCRDNFEQIDLSQLGIMALNIEDSRLDEHLAISLETSAYNFAHLESHDDVYSPGTVIGIFSILPQSGPPYSSTCTKIVLTTASTS